MLGGDHAATFLFLFKSLIYAPHLPKHSLIKKIYTGRKVYFTTDHHSILAWYSKAVRRPNKSAYGRVLKKVGPHPQPVAATRARVYDLARYNPFGTSLVGAMIADDDH